MDGPPFSVDEDVVNALYGADACKRLEERREVPSPRFVEAGVEDIVERIYLVRGR
jgi:Thiopurine S-methyltransferase (TPMT)